MSQAINPPSIYFNGINFNSSFYEQTPGGGSNFTKEQADELYLSKQINDTSIGKPTFIQGAYANDYDINEAANLFTIAQSATIETLIHVANDQVQATDLYNVNINRINLVGNRYSAPNIASWDDYSVFQPTLVGEYLEVIGPSITPTLNTNSFYPAASHPFAIANQGQYNMKVTFQINGSAISGTTGIIAFGITTSSSASTNWLYANNGNLTGSLFRNHVQNLGMADLPIIYNIDFNFIAVGSNYYFKYYFQASSLTGGSLIMSYYITKIC
jgi:hypothetical protein